MCRPDLLDCGIARGSGKDRPDGGARNNVASHWDAMSAARRETRGGTAPGGRRPGAGARSSRDGVAIAVVAPLDGLARTRYKTPCGEAGRRCCGGAQSSRSRCWPSPRRLTSTTRPRDATTRASCATSRVRRSSLPPSTKTPIRRPGAAPARASRGMPALPRSRGTPPGRLPPDDSPAPQGFAPQGGDSWQGSWSGGDRSRRRRFSGQFPGSVAASTRRCAPAVPLFFSWRGSPGEPSRDPERDP